MKMVLYFILLSAVVGAPLAACTSPKKKTKDGPKSMFGYPYKGRHGQVKDAFGG